jgi:hypothetical protein
MVNPLAKTCGVAFKEWAGVCDALIAGRQAVVIRKGGISETAGPGGFAPEHSLFWLFPTWVHQAEQGLRIAGADSPTAKPVDRDGPVPIHALVAVDVIGYVGKEETLPSLEEFHIFTAETILKRFHYRRPGFWVLGARVWRREAGLKLASTPEHSGCKTWVFLDLPLPTAGLEPVLDDARWAGYRDRLRAIFDREN